MRGFSALNKELFFYTAQKNAKISKQGIFWKLKRQLQMMRNA